MSNTEQTLTREEYLREAAYHIGFIFQRYADVELPEFQVSCSWPGGGSANKRIGECWPRSWSGAGINEIFISPMIEDSVRALDILCHELVHAVDDCKDGHGPIFTKMARAIGLEGKPTATHAGERLHAELREIVDQLGPYPHKKLTNNGKKQKNRQIKLQCSDCGAIWRMSRTVAQQASTCPCCQSDDIEIDA